ncbi:MAG: hypothetical protein M1817_002340 [Caeruleum heppii]|nr:MAG: hypothetical protein M1817_002340 [Caeruleum heppii]
MESPRRALLTLTPIDFVDQYAARALTLVPDQSPIRIGRASKTEAKGLFSQPDNACFDSPVMSRDHATISASKDTRDTLKIEDCGSMHGTFVNNRRLAKHAPHTLEDGDTLTFGTVVTRGPQTFPARSYTIRFTWQSYKSPPSPPMSSRSTFSAPIISDSEDESDSMQESKEEVKPGTDHIGSDDQKTEATRIDSKASTTVFIRDSASVELMTAPNAKSELPRPEQKSQSRLFDSQPTHSAQKQIEDSFDFLGSAIPCFEDNPRPHLVDRDEQKGSDPVSKGPEKISQALGSQQHPIELANDVVEKSNTSPDFDIIISDDEGPEETTIQFAVDKAIPEPQHIRFKQRVAPFTQLHLDLDDDKGQSLSCEALGITNPLSALEDGNVAGLDSRFEISVDEASDIDSKARIESALPHSSQDLEADTGPTVNVVEELIQRETQSRKMKANNVILVKDSQVDTVTSKVAHHQESSDLSEPSLATATARSGRAPSPSDAAMPKSIKVQMHSASIDTLQTVGAQVPDKLQTKLVDAENRLETSWAGQQESTASRRAQVYTFCDTSCEQRPKKDVSLMRSSVQGLLNRADMPPCHGLKRKAQDEALPIKQQFSSSSDSRLRFDSATESLEYPDAQRVNYPDVSETLDLDDAYPMPSSTTEEALEDAQPRKRARTSKGPQTRSNRASSAAKFLGGAIFAGVGVFLALAASLPEPI